MITVYGSINLDIVNKVDRFPAPGETVLTPEGLIAPGGKGANQAVAAACAGGSVYMAGAVGSDGLSVAPLNALSEAGVDTRGIAVLPDKSTAIASVMVDASGENRIIVASNANGAVPTLSSGHVAPGGMLVLQMEIPLTSIEHAVQVAKKQNAKVILNMAPFSPIESGLISSLDILILNEGEAVALAEHLSVAATEPSDVAKELSAFGPATVITLGARGYVCSDSGDTFAGPAFDVTVIDTTGAGDAFCGCLAAALHSHEMPLRDALRFASAGASLACTQLGAQSAYASQDEILALL